MWWILVQNLSLRSVFSSMTGAGTLKAFENFWNSRLEMVQSGEFWHFRHISVFRAWIGLDLDESQEWPIWKEINLWNLRSLTLYAWNHHIHYPLCIEKIWKVKTWNGAFWCIVAEDILRPRSVLSFMSGAGNLFMEGELFTKIGNSDLKWCNLVNFSIICNKAYRTIVRYLWYNYEIWPF